MSFYYQLCNNNLDRTKLYNGFTFFRTWVPCGFPQKPYIGRLFFVEQGKIRVRRPILALVSYFEQLYRLSSGLDYIILRHMAKHLFLNNILIDQQHGFREKFSCEAQLISAIHDWAKGINFRSQTDVILLDFSKAFDSVPHERLVVKLDFHGIRGKVLNWIRAFLTNRKQKVSVNGVLSLSRHVVSGVTQGSVLGLVLFLLFINDISNSIHSNLRLFADDCVLYRR